METWAHGQDVADALAFERPATDRLRHVVHIGIGARPFAYPINRLEVPGAGLRIELQGPNGGSWT